MKAPVNNEKLKLAKKVLGQMSRKGKVTGKGLSDKDIRKSLLAKLKKEGIIVEEFKLGECRADIVVIWLDGLCWRMTAYEIKSDRDSLTRICSQASQYNRFSDQCVLVSNKLARDALKVLPDSWGVLYSKDSGSGVKNRCEIHSFRAPKISSTSDWVELDLLWRRELLDILVDLKVSGYNAAPKEKIEEVIKEKVFNKNPQAFRQEALRRIYGRKDWRRRDPNTIHKYPIGSEYARN